MRTLAYALVFRAEVSIGAASAIAGGGGDGGEYVRLVRWMEDSVGVENVPDQAAVDEAMRKVDARESESEGHRLRVGTKPISCRTSKSVYSRDTQSDRDKGVQIQ